MTPKTTADWFKTLKPASKRDTLAAVDGAYSYRSDGCILLAEAAPDAELPGDKYGGFVAAVRTAEVSGTVCGLRRAVRSLKAFAAEDGQRVSVHVNGAMIVEAECVAGSARSTIDGADYTHSGPDVDAAFGYRYLMQALDGLPETVAYHIQRHANGAVTLALAATVRGAQREALLAALRPRQ